MTPEEMTAEYYRLSRLADAAFLRWFAKNQRGERTNGAAVQRLENRINYLTAEMYAAGINVHDLPIEEIPR